MALLDFLKNKEDAQKSKKAEKAAPASVAKKEHKKEAKKAAPKKETPKTLMTSGAFSLTAITRPHISEKASVLAEQNQYIFEVSSRANKTEIRKAVEGMYQVKALGVKIIKVPGKKRRLGMIEGMRKGYKKAIVTIKEGQKIEII